jgi:uncharacterized membrane protein YbhN (UPF0104 family)
VILLGLAAWVLWREFHSLSLEAVATAMAAWGPARIVAAIGLSAVSFVLMGIIEWVGLRWSGAQLSVRTAMWGSFIANAIAHSVGANLLVSGAIRVKLYGRYSVTLGQVAGATFFGGWTFAVGLAALAGAGLLIARPAELAATAIPVIAARALGVVMVSFALGYVAACALRHKPLTAFGRSMTLPSAREAAFQLVVGVADNGIAAAIVWTLLPPGATRYASFVGAYAVACVGGLLSSVPGGVGVFEGGMAALLPHVDAAALAAAFLGYRLVYYLAPLLLASLALAADTVRNRDG